MTSTVRYLQFSCRFLGKPGAKWHARTSAELFPFTGKTTEPSSRMLATWRRLINRVRSCSCLVFTRQSNSAPGELSASASAVERTYPRRHLNGAACDGQIFRSTTVLGAYKATVCGRERAAADQRSLNVGGERIPPRSPCWRIARRKGLF